MAVPITHLLYLHGFRSSPRSTKAQWLAAWMAAHRPDVAWHCPQLAASPRAAVDTIEDTIAGWPRETMAVIGSSLGGWYATIVAERTGCRCVVLNPAVEPARDLVRHVGVTTTWHGNEPFEFRAEYVDEARALAPGAITHLERYYAIIAKGDELLSWEEMTARYRGTTIDLIEGGDHALTDFAAHWDDAAAWLGLGPGLTR
jgi:predicted esterase YcpF (UPF0227 family)